MFRKSKKFATKWLRVKKNNTQLAKKHRNLGTGINFIYMTLMLLFFAINHELLYERNKNYAHKPRFCHVTKINQSQ